MSTLPAKALDVQLDLLRWTESRPGAAYSASVIEAAFSEQAEQDIEKQSFSPETWRKVIGTFGKACHTYILGTEDTYAITADIVEVLEAASVSIPPYALHAEDLPTLKGFVYLERPIVIHDGKSKTMVVQAFGWHAATRNAPLTSPAVILEERGTQRKLGTELGTEGDGVLLMVWSKPEDERDHMHDEFMNDLEAMRKVSFGPAPHGLYSCLGGLWEYGKVPTTDLFAFLLTFFRFVGEPWVDSRLVLPERPVLRRAKRAGRPEPKIRVVALRRRAARTHHLEDGTPVEWSHRWLVRGHWRNQWYPSIQDHRPKWITEHIRGPEDKPLIVHDHVFHVSR